MTGEEVRAAAVDHSEECTADGLEVSWDPGHSVGSPSAPTMVGIWNDGALQFTPFEGPSWFADAVGYTTKILVHSGPGGLGPLKVDEDPNCPLGPRYGRMPVVFQLLGQDGGWNAVGVGELVAHSWMEPHRYRPRVYYRLAVNVTPELHRTLESAWTVELGREVVVDTVQVHLKTEGRVMLVSAQGHEVASGAPAGTGVRFTWSRKYGPDGMILE